MCVSHFVLRCLDRLRGWDNGWGGATRPPSAKNYTVKVRSLYLSKDIITYLLETDGLIVLSGKVCRRDKEELRNERNDFGVENRVV